MNAQDTANNIFVDFNAESQHDLLGNAGTAPVGITPFPFNDGLDEFFIRSFGTRPTLHDVFGGKFVAALKQAFRDGQLNFQGDLKLLAQTETFAAWLRPLHRHDWVVYLKRPFGDPGNVLQYLGRYTHRVAISNRRLVSIADGQVTFRWRDSADHDKQKPLPLPVDEFLSRFLLHLLPEGFVRIRNFGFLANRKRATLLALCFHLLGSAQES